MRIALSIPFAVSVVLSLTAPAACRRLPPRPASWLLVLAAVVTAGGWAAALGMLAFTLISRFPELAADGGWSSGVLVAHTPVNWLVAAASAALLTICTGMLSFAAWQRTRTLVRARRQSREFATSGELAVVDDPVPTAFALPGSPGRVVVSSSMLRALGAGEQRALLAHERAHLRHRHHLFLLVAQLAAAVNPLLRPVAGAVGYAVERWADEEAAASVADRALVARAVARAALAVTHAPRTGLAATGGPVPQRVRALLAPPPPLRGSLVVAHAALMVLCCASLILSARDMDQLFDMASPAHTGSVVHTGPAHGSPRAGSPGTSGHRSSV